MLSLQIGKLYGSVKTLQIGKLYSAKIVILCNGIYKLMRKLSIPLSFFGRPLTVNRYSISLKLNCYAYVKGEDTIATHSD